MRDRQPAVPGRMARGVFTRLVVAILAVCAVIALAWGLRFKASNALPRDFDEGGYLSASGEIRSLIRQGAWPGLLEANQIPEHPQFNKILFALAMGYLPPPQPHTEHAPDPMVFSPQGYSARRLSAAFGALTAGLLALLNPAAGLLLAVHTMTIKYTSQVMLESVPAFFVTAAVICYAQSRKHMGLPWWIASGILLGLAAGSKYLYGVAGIAILADCLIDLVRIRAARMRRLGMLAGWGLLALAAFCAANPYLWPDPAGRLYASLAFHPAYAAGAHVAAAGFPWYQPILWLVTSPITWHPEGVFLFAIDPAIAVLGLLGLVRLWRRERVYVLWLLSGLAFLLAWPTKWPQYVLVLTPPLALAAGEAVMIVFRSMWKDLAPAEPESQHADQG